MSVGRATRRFALRSASVGRNKRSRPSRPALSIALTAATIIAAFTALPVWLPRTFVVAGLTVQVYELLLVAAALGWLLRGRPKKSTDRTAVILLLLLAIAFALSLIAGAPVAAVIFETRRLVVLAVAVFVAGRASRESDRRMVTCVSVSLWVSAAFTVLASATGLDLGQRALAASLEYGDASAATRLLTDATYLAVSVLGVMLCLYIAGKFSGRWFWTLVLPSLLIVLLSFSRNPLLSIGLALLVALVRWWSAPTLMRVVRLLLIGVALLGVVWLISLVDPYGGVARWLESQVAGFADRVIGGLSGDALAVDQSALYRSEQEDPYLVSAFQEAPLFGHGFGYEYKPAFTGRRYATVETAIAASRYAHHFYLWLMVKTGAVGLIAFLALAFFPVLRAVFSRRTSAVTTALAIALGGMFVQSFVAPMPIGSPTSLLFGALLGLTVAGLSTARSGDAPVAQRLPVPPAVAGVMSRDVIA